MALLEADVSQLPPQEAVSPVLDGKAELRAIKTRNLFFTVWAVIGCLLIGVAAWFFLQQLSEAIAVLIVGSLLVFILRVPVQWLEGRNVPRWLGSLIAYAAVIAIIVIFSLIIVPFLTTQLIGLISMIPGYISQTSQIFQELYQTYGYLLEDSSINQVFNSIATTISEWAAGFVTAAPGSALTFGSSLVSALLVSLVSLIAGYWVLKDLPTIKLEINTIIGPRYNADMSFIASACSRAIGGYLQGMLVAGTCVGCISGIGFVLIGMPYPALLGLLAGMMMFIPIFGPWVTGITVSIIGIFISPLTALLAVIIFILAVQFTDTMITPRVMSSTVELHPALVLVGVFAGGVLAGLPGLVSAIPLLASAKSIFVYYFEKRTGRKLSHPEGALFKGRVKERRRQGLSERLRGLIAARPDAQPDVQPNAQPDAQLVAQPESRDGSQSSIINDMPETEAGLIPNNDLSNNREESK